MIISGGLLWKLTDDPPKGEEFDKWVILKGNPAVDDIDQPTTELTMPGENVIVEKGDELLRSKQMIQMI